MAATPAAANAAANAAESAAAAVIDAVLGYFFVLAQQTAPETSESFSRQATY